MLRPKGVPFQAQGISNGKDFTRWSTEKGTSRKTDRLRYRLELSESFEKTHLATDLSKKLNGFLQRKVKCNLTLRSIYTVVLGSDYMGRPDAQLLHEKYFREENLWEYRWKGSLFIEIVIHSVIFFFIWSECHVPWSLHNKKKSWRLAL